jgi:hypothetical protein
VGGNQLAANGIFGTLSNNNIHIYSNNVQRGRVLSTGPMVYNNTGAVAGDVFSSYASGTTGAISALGDIAIAGYSNGANGNAIFGQNNGSTGIGVFGISNGGTIGAAGVYGWSNGSDATVGQATSTSPANAFGVWGINQNTVGSGVVGSGNNGSSIYLNQGAGVSGTGDWVGVHGAANSTSTTGANVRAGGYFTSGSSGGANPTFSTWAYVGAMSNAVFGLGNGSTARKIEGVGTVNTIVENLNGEYVVLSAPEAPENLFQDFGTGKLINGTAHVNLDPVLTKNIVVNNEHPLRVFIQLEGDCKGVYVINKTANGFDVKELDGGNSNVNFTWFITANRADQTINGNTFLFSKERFGKAISPMPSSSKSLINNEVISNRINSK